MDGVARASHRRFVGQTLLFLGSLLVASGLFFPWLIAGVAGAECGMHTCIPTGPVMTTVSGWRLLHGNGAPGLHVMNYSYLALAPVFAGFILLGIALLGLMRPLPRLLIQAFTALTIAGLLVLGVEIILAATNVISSSVTVAEVLPAILILFGGFALNIAGIIRLLPHMPRIPGWRKAA